MGVAVLPAGLSERIVVRDDCWIWTGATNWAGYGLINRGGNVGVHRYVYEQVVGPIPKGQQIDHLCHDPETCDGGIACPHRACVNPEHLCTASGRDNTLRGNAPTAINARKTHCPKGHSYDEQNTFVNRAGERVCRTCRLAHERRYRAEKRKKGADDGEV